MSAWLDRKCCGLAIIISYKKLKLLMLMLSPMLINIKMASCIVNNSPSNVDNHQHQSHNSEALNFPSSPFGGFYPLYRTSLSSSREFKSGIFGVAPLKPPFPELFNRFQGATTQNNNLVQTQNDHVDAAAISDNVGGPIGPAVGYPFPPTNTKGAGAFHYQNIYPYGVR